MSVKPINKLFNIIGGKPAPKGENAFCEKGTPFVKMKDLGRAHFSSDLIDIEQKVSDEIAKINKLNLIKRGSILLPRSGSVALNHRAVLGVDAYMVSHICALEVIDEKEVNNLYAYYYLRSIKMDRISKKTTGLDAITFEDLGKIKIPLPPLDDQKRIAHLLGKVEGLIARRKHHLQQLDDLLKSVFLEMFGDPVRNEKGWEPRSIGNSVEIQSGQVDPRVAPYSEMLHIGGANIESESGRLLELKLAKSENLISGKYLFDQNYILYSKIRPYLNKVAKPDFSGICSADIYPIKPIDGVLNRDFLRQLLMSQAFLKHAANNSDRANIPKINRKALDAFSFICPPIYLQNQFAAIVEKVERIKSRYQQSLTDLENLYGALSQKAFKGELDLSRVVLPAEGPELVEEETTDMQEKQPMEPLFELPAPEELALLQTAEGRKSLLGEWLNAWLAHLGDAPLSAQKFIDAARQRLWELAEDDTPDWGVAEYDELKNWVFKALEQGRLTQGYDAANNRVQITEAKG